KAGSGGINSVAESAVFYVIFLLLAKCCGGPKSGTAIGFSVQNQAISIVSKAIQCGRGKKPVRGEGLVPFGQIQIARHDSGGFFIALGDQFVEIFISRRAQWLQAEVIDDQQWYTGKRCQPSIVGAHS